MMNELTGCRKDIRREMRGLFVISLLNAIVSSGSVFSVAPFVAVVANPTLIHSNVGFRFLYETFHFGSNKSFFLFLGFLTIIAILAINMTLLYLNYKTTSVVFNMCDGMANTLLQSLTQKDYLFFAGINSAYLVNKVIGEVNRVSKGYLIPLMQVLAQFCTIAITGLALLFVNWQVTLVSVVVLSATYVFLYMKTKDNLKGLGKSLSDINENKIKTMNELYGGIKEIIILNCFKLFIETFNRMSREFTRINIKLTLVGSSPRQIIESIAFTGVVVTLMVLVFWEHSLESSLPVLTVFAMAGYKLIPAFQQLYVNLTTAKNNETAFVNLVHLIRQNQDTATELASSEKIKDCEFEQSLKLNDITFTYPDGTQALSNVQLQIKKGQKIAIVGRSGSGKSTLMDILIGVLRPTSGQIFVDGQAMTLDQQAWRNKISFVSQNIFLLDCTLAENIAFGVPKDEIDQQKLQMAIDKSLVSEFLAELSNGLETNVGERGLRLSGGQRQRIALARAYYRSTPLIFLDEATSSLDSLTESKITEQLAEIRKNKTVVLITHKLSNAKDCDYIYYLAAGKIVEEGAPDQLLAITGEFSKMLQHQLSYQEPMYDRSQ